MGIAIKVAYSFEVVKITYGLFQNDSTCGYYI
jgi:hypothetical protein